MTSYTSGQPPVTVGFLEIISNHPIAVTAVYTVTGLSNGSTSIDVENIAARPS